MTEMEELRAKLTETQGQRDKLLRTEESITRFSVSWEVPLVSFSPSSCFLG